MPLYTRTVCKYNPFSTSNTATDKNLDSSKKTTNIKSDQGPKKTIAVLDAVHPLKSCNSGVRFHHPPSWCKYSSRTGYKFETLSTLPKTWGETTRDYIENRENEIVNNKEQYCSVVRTGIGSTVLCLGGEVDASTFFPLQPSIISPRFTSKPDINLIQNPQYGTPNPNLASL